MWSFGRTRPAMAPNPAAQPVGKSRTCSVFSVSASETSSRRDRLVLPWSIGEEAA
jgi:hypothetical protein